MEQKPSILRTQSNEEENRLWTHIVQVQSPTWTHISCVILGKLPNLAVSSFLHHYNKHSNNLLVSIRMW